jgi:photosystem II oxygen-evolving enhancer protein 3
MANAVAMAGVVCGTAVQGSLITGNNALFSGSINSKVAFRPAVVVARAERSDDAFVQTRRSMLGLLAATVAGTVIVKEARAGPESIKIYPPPPPSGGLPGTENADQARDTDLPLRQRFFIQPLSVADAAQRAKFSAQDIMAAKTLIDKKAWPYVQNALRSSAGYLRYDLNTVISSKPKEEKKTLKALTAKLFDSLNALDFAARSKSTKDSEKYYSQTVMLLNDVLAKIA